MKILITSAFLIILFTCNVFSQQPSISVNNVQWHSFNMNMGNYPDNITGTRWLITQSPYGEGDTVLDTRWNECNVNIADRRDLFSKLITGCIPGQEYKARVSYFNGAWSQFSNPATFNIPDAPPLTGNDTVHIVLWGHSFIDYGDQCGQITNIFSGIDYPDAPYDLIGHVMKTELRKLTGKKNAVINRGVAGSLQHDWYKDYHSLYEPGGIYSDNSKYPVAIFFFGTNDAHGEVDANQYGDDMRKIINYLLSRGVKVITNSIHYANDHEHEFDIPFFEQWNTVMSEFSNNPNNRKGLDLLHLIKADTVRFMAGDEAHPNRSEGLPLVAHMIDSLLLLASSWVGINNIDESVPEKFTLIQNLPNPLNTLTKIKFKIQCYQQRILTM